MVAKVNMEKCTVCENCVSSCPVEAISMANSKASISSDKCLDCGACVSECPVEAISL